MRPPGSPLTTVRSWRYLAAVALTDAAPFHGDCARPITHEIRGRESDLLSRLRTYARDDVDYVDGYGWLGRPSTMAITDTAYVQVRCRRCEQCLAYRRRLWTARAIAETRMSMRTWFVTLTFAPQWRWQAEALAAKLCRERRAESFTALSADEQFRAIERQTSAEVTRWLKRVRKNSSASLRYLLVSEAHSDGFPHYHLLVHQTDDMAVTKRQLQLAWRTGFSNCKLISNWDAKATGYVCKYLSKTASTRVRASQKYGAAKASDLNERLDDIVKRLADACSKYITEGKTAYLNRSERSATEATS